LWKEPRLACKRGRIGGRPRVDKKIVEKALKLYESKEYSVAEITELTGVSKATLYRRLKESAS
jgi:AcrR family transcriptional regulator